MKKQLILGTLSLCMVMGTIVSAPVTAFAQPVTITDDAGNVYTYDDGMPTEEELAAERAAAEEANRAAAEAEQRSIAEDTARGQAEAQAQIDAYFAEIRAQADADFAARGWVQQADGQWFPPEQVQSSTNSTDSSVQQQIDNQTKVVNETKNNVSNSKKASDTKDAKKPDEASGVKDTKKSNEASDVKDTKKSNEAIDTKETNEAVVNNEDSTSAKVAVAKGVKNEDEAVELLEEEGNTDVSIIAKVGNFFGGVFKNVAGVWESFVGFFRK